MQQFALHEEKQFNESLQIVCVGGVGGSDAFIRKAEKTLYGKDAPLDLNTCSFLLKSTPQVAQASIARGGVFLSEEKDHINFDAEQVHIYEDSPDLRNVPSSTTMKWRYETQCNFSNVVREETFFKF